MEPPGRGSCATKIDATARMAIPADARPAITPFLVLRRPTDGRIAPGISGDISNPSARRRNASRISASVVCIAAHLLPHALESAGHGGLHRADAAAEHSGRLLLREVLVEAQHDRRALSVGEFLQRSP